MLKPRFGSRLARKGNALRRTAPGPFGAGLARAKARPGAVNPNASIQQALKSARMRVQQKGDLVRAQLILPDGRKFQAMLEATPEALAGDELAGRFLKKLGRVAKKATLGPLKLAHKITHHPKSPIAKAEKAMQKFVKKNLPIAAPFINIHNSLAKPVHKAIEGKKVKKKVIAAAIVDATKNMPAATKAATQQALVLKAKQNEAVLDVAKKAAKAKVVTAAAKALKKDPGNVMAKKVINAAKPQAGYYIVTNPAGKVSRIPAARVH